jgi:hypothetical protein
MSTGVLDGVISFTPSVPGKTNMNSLAGLKIESLRRSQQREDKAHVA